MRKWKKQRIVFCSFFYQLSFSAFFLPQKESKHISSIDLFWCQIFVSTLDCQVNGTKGLVFVLIYWLKASLIFRIGTDNMAGAAYTGFLSRFVGWVQFANFKTAKSLVRKKHVGADLVLVWVYTPPCFVSHVEDRKVYACSREMLQIMDPSNSEFVIFAISAGPKHNFDLCHTNEQTTSPTWYFYHFGSKQPECWTLDKTCRSAHVLWFFWKEPCTESTTKLVYWTCANIHSKWSSNPFFRSLKACQDGKRRFEFVGEWRRRGGLPDYADYTRGFCFLKRCVYDYMKSLILDD